MSRFDVGDRVCIDARSEPRHHRVPAYVKGHCGEVVRVCAEQGRPEDLGYGICDGERVSVYRVRLRQSDLWPDYPGPSRDTLDIEIYEHWLREG